MKKIIALIILCVVLIIMMIRKIIKQKELLDKFTLSYFKTRDWLNLSLYGIRISEKLKMSGVRSVAIYGYGLVGKMLYRDLKSDGINVEYAIDECASSIYWDEVNIYFPYEQLPPVDLIIISVFETKQKIESELQDVSDSKIKYLSDLIDEIKEGENINE